MRMPRAVMLAACLFGCSDDVQAPGAVPAILQVLSDVPTAGVAGSAVGAFVVRVTDASGAPVPDVVVQFAPTLGAARVTPARDTTGADGVATAAVTLSTTPGPNQIEALVAGVRVRSAISIGSTGETRRFTLSPRVLWFQPTTERRTATAIPRDEHGNPVGGGVTWISRNPSLVSVASSGATTGDVQLVGRPGQTYLVATHGGATDSILVAVHDSSSSRCDFLAAPVNLRLGEALSFETAGLTCVRADDAAEYVVVGHYNSPLASASSGVGVSAHGIAPIQPSPGSGALRGPPGAPTPHHGFEAGLRARERGSLPAHLPGARAWYDARSRTRALSAVTRVGDQVSVNVNAFQFCTEPIARTARVAALTAGTMILEDTSNPSGGFTDEEYQAIATTVDTLVLPVNTEAFGAPTDIDDNGRIAILFTRAVNELTPRGAGGVVLGFYYSRDLLPRNGVAGACPGSNAGEIFYVMVPDPGAVLGDARTKVFVQGIAISTVAHELQHLISTSRRMYVTRAQEAIEETWLNEALSHIAEELVFYRASGLSPRQNIGGAQLSPGTRVRDMLELFMRGNFGRYAEFLEATPSSSPMAGNDQLTTRGAGWAFLRYIADRAGAVDGDLWRRLVDGNRVGALNVEDAIAGSGVTVMTALQHWSAAVAVDHLAAASAPHLSQPSWDFATAMPALGYRGGPDAFSLLDGQPSSLQVRAGGSIYFLFGLDAGREALVQISSGGGVAQPGMRLTIVRIR